MVLREQTWQLQIPEPQVSALPRRESSAFPSNNPFHCAGVWDQKESAEDSLGLGSKSVAPENDKTSVEGTLPLAPTGLAPGIYRAMEAQLWPVCPL